MKIINEDTGSSRNQTLQILSQKYEGISENHEICLLSFHYFLLNLKRILASCRRDLSETVKLKFHT